jgi:PleD family two-component response regulator
MQSSLFLVHWDESEIEDLAQALSSQGWPVVGMEAVDGRTAYQQVKTLKPDVLVVYLTRKPSHGRETAVSIRSLKAFRELPIVFVGGTETAVSVTQAKLPGAIFTTPNALPHILSQFKDN